MKQEIQDYQERMGEPTQADAVRHLIREGMKAEGGRRADALQQVGYALLAVSLALLTFQARLLAGTVAVAAALVLLVSAAGRMGWWSP